MNYTQNYEKLKSDYDRLKTGLKELAILNEIATTINSTLEVNRIINTIVQKCIKHFAVEQGNISLINEAEISVPLKTMIRHYNSEVSRIPFRIDEQLIGWILTKKAPLIINDLANDQRFSSLAKETTYHSILAVPMMYKRRITGVLSLFNKQDKQGFSKDDLRLLSIIATESSQVIENARLLEEEQKLTSFREELKIAGSIQKHLLPSVLPSITGYQVAAVNIPAKEVGGDYYDVIPLGDNKVAFCFGDVSGKGIASGLIMANLQATMRSLMLSEQNVADCVRKANKLIHATTTIDKYITFFLGILNLDDHSFSYCNAGHDQPLHLQKDNIKKLNSGGIPLGFLQDYEYKDDKNDIWPGNTLVIYTDGVTEAMNENDEEFGLDRLSEILMLNKNKSAEEMLNEILAAIKNYSKGVEQMDDITMIIIKRDGSH